MNVSANQLSQPLNGVEKSRFLTPLYLEFLDKSEIPGTSSHFKLTHDFKYFSELGGREIKVPKDHPTDFASVPQVFLSLIPRVGTYGKATVIHDYLCVQSWEEPDIFESREEADKIFLEAMGVLNVFWPIKHIMFIAVWLWSIYLKFTYFLKKSR